MNIAHSIVEDTILWCSTRAGMLTKEFSCFLNFLTFSEIRISTHPPNFPIHTTATTSPHLPQNLTSTDSPFRGGQIPAHFTCWVRSSQSWSYYFTSPRGAVCSHDEDKSRNSAKPQNVGKSCKGSFLALCSQETTCQAHGTEEGNQDHRFVPHPPSSGRPTQSLSVQSELFHPTFLAHEVCSMQTGTNKSLLKS